MGWRDAQRSGVLADFPEGLGSVTTLLRDLIPTSDLLGMKHTHGAQGIHADKRPIHTKYIVKIGGPLCWKMRVYLTAG